MLRQRSLLTICAFLITFVPSLRAQRPLQNSGMAWGNSPLLTNGVLTIVAYASTSAASGTKMSFILNAKTTIVCEAGCGPGGKSVSTNEIVNYSRVRVEYAESARGKIAKNIILDDPIRPSAAKPSAIAHAAEAEEHIRRGLALHNKRDLDRAIAEYKTAISLNPNYQNAYNNLGNALDEQGKSREAIKAYQAALNLNPSYAAAHYNLALVLEKLGDKSAAEGHFRAACPAMPNQYCQQAAHSDDQLAGETPLQAAERNCSDVLGTRTMSATENRAYCKAAWLEHHGYCQGLYGDTVERPCQPAY